MCKAILWAWGSLVQSAGNRLYDAASECAYSVYGLRPAVVILGLVLEPGFDRLRFAWWRRVSDPGCEFRHTLRPLIEDSLERARQPTKIDMRIPLGCALS